MESLLLAYWDGGGGRAGSMAVWISQLVNSFLWFLQNIFWKFIISELFNDGGMHGLEVLIEYRNI